MRKAADTPSALLCVCRIWKDVTEPVWRAVNDPSSPILIPAGVDAHAWAEAAR